MDKLIDQLRTLSTAILNPHHLTGEYVDKRFAGVAIEAANVIEDLPRWIPVTERMPPDSGDVIVYSASHLVGVGCYLPNRFVGQEGRWVQWYSGGGIGISVTHWMPLPKGPDLTGAEKCDKVDER